METEILDQPRSGHSIPCADPERVATSRAQQLDERTYGELAEIFRALGDPTRAKIAYGLMDQELRTCDLAELTGISDSAVSQHVRVLRGLRLVRSRRSGKHVFHSLDDAHIAILLQVGLSHVQDGDAGHATMERLLEQFGTVGEGEGRGK
jgi:ArsR family transcriptional regulator, lead/cadmium/zinc/bismuth-responsive transcriptional repressor